MPHTNGGVETLVTLDPLEIEPDRAEVLRYLGYPEGASAAARIEEKLDEAIETCRGKLRPRGLYALYRVTERTPGSLTLEGWAKFSGEVGEFLEGAHTAAVFLATAGPETVQFAEAATRSRQTLAGLIYNAIGSQLAEAVVERLVADLAGRAAPGDCLTLRYSPGYCGISLAQQRTIFRLVDGGRIGVELLPTLIMKPVKSVSGLIGIGPDREVKAFGNPCDRCPKLDCRMRRELRGAGVHARAGPPGPAGSGPRKEFL